jgi:hypothetical protein
METDKRSECTWRCSLWPVGIAKRTTQPVPDRTATPEQPPTSGGPESTPLESLCVLYLGPLGKRMLRRTLRTSPTPHAALHVLAAKIGSQSEREAFLDKARALIGAHLIAAPGSNPTARYLGPAHHITEHGERARSRQGAGVDLPRVGGEHGGESPRSTSAHREGSQRSVGTEPEVRPSAGWPPTSSREVPVQQAVTARLRWLARLAAERNQQ